MMLTAHIVDYAFKDWMKKMEYTIEGVDGVYSGRELMKAGMITSDPSAGQVLDGGETCTDFWSKIYLLHGEK